MQRLVVTLLLLSSFACNEETRPPPLITDAGRSDVFTGHMPSDGGDDEDADVDVDATVDGGTPLACTGAPFDLRPLALGSDVEVAIAGSASDLLAVWTVASAGGADVFARRIPATGEPGALWQITETNELESSPTVLKYGSGSDWLLAWIADGSATDVIAYGLNPADPIGATQVNVSNDISDDAAPRLFASNGASRLLWYKPSIDGASVAQLNADGAPGVINAVDDVNPLAAGPYVFARGTSGLGAFLRTGDDTIGVLPLTSAGVASAEISTFTVSSAVDRLAFSLSGTSARVFVETSSSIAMRALGTNGLPTGSTATAPTSGSNERAPAALGLPNGHVLAYRTSSVGGPLLRVAVLSPSNGSLISDTSITALESLDGEVAIARSTDGTIVVVYSDTSGTSASVHAVRLTCTGG